jgi:hypothetical protein
LAFITGKNPENFMEQEDHNISEIECPNCGYAVQAEITTTIRPQDQAIEKLFENTLNFALCVQCSKEFFCDTPMVFKSKNSDYFIYFNPDIAELGWQEAEAQMQKALDASLAVLSDAEKPECRLTITRNDFIEKIAIHLADLDDRIIEYLKYHIYSQEGLSQEEYTLLYDFSRSDNEIIEFSVIDKNAGKLLHNTQTPHGMLAKIQNQLDQDECPIELDEIFSGLYVQVEKLYK